MQFYFDILRQHYFGDRNTAAPTNTLAGQYRLGDAKLLWVGSAGSNIVPHELLGVSQDAVLTFHNIANQIKETDQSFASVLQYATTELKIEYIIVCGDYNCRGIQAALQSFDVSEEVFGDNALYAWISDVKYLAYRNWSMLKRLPTQPARTRRLAELNVMEQVLRLRHHSHMKDYPQIKILPWVFDAQYKRIVDLSFC